MYYVRANDLIAPNIHRIILSAPRIASSRKAGQFVIVRADETCERIPLTIADADCEAGTITIIVQAIGHSTKKIVSKAIGDSIRDVAGPLGHPTEIEKFGRVVCVGGGVGTAVLFPLAKGLADTGNEVTSIIGGRSAEHILLRDELSEFCQNVYTTTEDGSAGTTGFVTTVLGELIADKSTRPSIIYAVGPVPMMKAVVAQASSKEIKTIVSLNPIMIDGTGMCGGCRVTIDGEIKFACIDGPEFDGSKVDFDELTRRQGIYKGHECKLEQQFKDQE